MINEAIEAWCSFRRVGEDGFVYETDTARVNIGTDAVASAPAILASLDVQGPFAVFYDRNTRTLGGTEIVDALRAAGHQVTAFELGERTDEAVIVCDDARIDEARALLATRAWGHAIAVGAGTMNDVVKMAAYREGLRYSVVGTAPSMNGYTSAIAAILSDGVKTTQPCRAPLAVFADPRVMAEAPYRMIASGIGDLYSKPVSNADWRLSHRLLGTKHSSIVMEIVEAGGRMLEGVAPHLPAREPDAVARLTGALMLSGLAMQAAGSSQSASGGEHLISHFIDMTAYAFDQPHDFHGCQVAVGTIATSRLYEYVRALDPATIDIDACVAAHREWPDHEAVLVERFGPLADAVIEHARKMYPTRETLRTRLETLVAAWDDIFADAGTTLRSADDLEGELRSADCPTRFAEIGVDAERAEQAVAWSKDIRARYTILHLAGELGVLDGFAAEYVAQRGGH